MSERVPPHNVEAEEAVLGSMLLSRDALERVLVALAVEDLYRPAHRTIFDAIGAMEAAGQAVDPVTVAEALRQEGQLDDVGGMPILHTLVSSVPTLANVDHYARIVKEAATLRRLIDTGTRITQLGYETPQDTRRAVGLATSWVGLVAASMNGSRPAAPGYVMLDTIQREYVHWLWPARIALGKVSILEGDPDRGKSVISLDLAARVSTGTPMPDDPARRAPAGAVVVCAEDDMADTVIPRLLAHGADLARIAQIPLERDEHGKVQPLSLPEDLARLEAAICGVGAELLIIDPITAYLSETINSSNDASVRRATTPLADLAQRTGCAILLIRHLNKAGDLKAKYRGGGSIAFTGAARSVLVVDEHPEQPGLMVLARVKNNLAKVIPSVSYKVESEPLYECPLIHWHGNVDMDADTLLRGHDSRHDAEARDEAAELLRDLLADGPLPVGEVKKLTEAAGVTASTLRRAKKHIGVRSDRARDAAGKTAGWTWRLPTDDEAESEEGESDAA